MHGSICRFDNLPPLLYRQLLPLAFFADKQKIFNVHILDSFLLELCSILLAKDNEILAWRLFKNLLHNELETAWDEAGIFARRGRIVGFFGLTEVGL